MSLSNFKFAVMYSRVSSASAFIPMRYIVSSPSTGDISSGSGYQLWNDLMSGLRSSLPQAYFL